MYKIITDFVFKNIASLYNVVHFCEL